VIAPEKKPAQKFKVSSSLWTLEGLKASALGENKLTSTKYGFGPMARAVTLYDRDGKSLARLELGHEVPGKAGQLYARGSRAQVLEVEAARLADLPKSLDELVASSPPATLPDGGPAATSN
ncbi:MAG TPA: DUF4340 domain-containing protein, partial [Myxococcaceae bacterium]|nr:DUF4340 domain-containing protein [Myxococcaceae bacterium]